MYIDTGERVVGVVFAKGEKKIRIVATQESTLTFLNLVTSLDGLSYQTMLKRT